MDETAKKAIVVTGYHEMEAEFGLDVTRYYESRGIRGDRNVSFYAVQDNKNSFDFEVPKVNREIREYLASRDQPDLLIDIHVGAADHLYPRGSPYGCGHDKIDVRCAHVPVSVVGRLYRLLGREHVIADVLLPWELDRLHDSDIPLADDDLEELLRLPDWTLAQTGIATIAVEPYLYMSSFEAKGRTYRRCVGRTARLINALYDLFAACDE